MDILTKCFVFIMAALNVAVFYLNVTETAGETTFYTGWTSVIVIFLIVVSAFFETCARDTGEKKSKEKEEKPKDDNRYGSTRRPY